MIVKQGTRWSGNDRTEFVVIHVIEQDGHVWVHYRKDRPADPKEYSCYEESFLSRFRPLPE